MAREGAAPGGAPIAVGVELLVELVLDGMPVNKVNALPFCHLDCNEGDAHHNSHKRAHHLQPHTCVQCQRNCSSSANGLATWMGMIAGLARTLYSWTATSVPAQVADLWPGAKGEPEHYNRHGRCAFQRREDRARVHTRILGQIVLAMLRTTV